jgi:hypothetical protein
VDLLSAPSKKRVGLCSSLRAKAVAAKTIARRAEAFYIIFFLI